MDIRVKNSYNSDEVVFLRMEWKNIFKEVPDFRRGNIFKLHELNDILLLSLFATLAGAENDEEIETYGREKQSFLSNFLSLPNGIPSHDTITRVFRYLNKDKFAECLQKYSRELMDFLRENHISIDGKICRATNKGGKKKNGICIITAWACEQNLCLGQLKTDEKSNEKTAIPALIEEIDIKNTVVSIDAIAHSPSIAEQIITKGGDYILSLKKNQKIVFEQVSDYMKTHQKLFEMDENIDFGSGRIETRRAYVAKNLSFVEDTLAWKGIKSVVMVHAKREIRDKVEEQYRFYLSSK